MDYPELTEKKRKAIEQEVFRKTSFLKLGDDADLDSDSHVSLEYVKRFLETPDNELADEIVIAYGTIKEAFKYAIRGTYPYLAKYNVLWGRIYIWLYCLKHDDPFWKEFIFPLMKKCKLNLSMEEDINRAEKLMDVYLDRQTQINLFLNKKHALPAQPPCDNEQNRQCSETETETLSGISKMPGRPKHVLFVNQSYEHQAREQFMNYLKQHKLSSRSIVASKTDTLNKTIACFCWRWSELGHIDDLSAAALYRFLDDVCQMKFDVTPKTFTNKMGEILRNPQSFDGLMGDIKAYICK